MLGAVFVTSLSSLSAVNLNSGSACFPGSAAAFAHKARDARTAHFALIVTRRAASLGIEATDPNSLAKRNIPSWWVRAEPPRYTEVTSYLLPSRFAEQDVTTFP